MKDKLIESLKGKIDKYNVFIDDVFVDNREDNRFLNVVLDSKEIIDLDKVTKVSEIINEEVDKLDLIDGSYILDIYAKEKGDL